MSQIAPLEFFARPVNEVALDLVGRDLLVTREGQTTRALIIETEAYGGPEDPASHAAFRPGGRAAIMWSQPGAIYVYAAYGMYPCLNIVTGSCGDPGAVLIRGIWMAGQDRPIHGPGRSSRALGVGLDDHGLVCDGRRIAVGSQRADVPVECTTRVGISRGTAVPWRFVLSREST